MSWSNFGSIWRFPYIMNDLFNIECSLIDSLPPLLLLPHIFVYPFHHLQWQCDYNSIQMSNNSTYIYSDISFFFTASQVIDYELGKHYGYSLQRIFGEFQEAKFTVEGVSSLIAKLFKKEQIVIKKVSRESHYKLQVDQRQMQKIIQNDGFKLILFGIRHLVNKGQESKDLDISNELCLKMLLNAFYTICYCQQKSGNTLELNTLYKETEFDNFLMKMITLTLEVHFIPIKKLSMIYTLVLSNLFHHKYQDGDKPCDQRLSQYISPIQIYEDRFVSQIPANNMLYYGYFENYRQDNPPASFQKKQAISSIENFYRKHNVGDCPLAQSIVVGLLRSLLTICNCQTHRKCQLVKGSGADSFRQWQLSYRYALEHQKIKEYLSESTLSRLEDYNQFDQNPPEQLLTSAQFAIYSQFYSFKIFTTSALTNFFMTIVLALKQNMVIQYTYFLQLISDANGILVFLKFLTDKFLYLDDIIFDYALFTIHKESDKKVNLSFKQMVMLTIYAVLNILYCSCNNYPQKIRNYLFEYNSYLIIKKIPYLFLLKTDNNQKREQQSSVLPSKEQLETLNQCKQSSTLKKLTCVCYDLLKIQIPFFSKKMKDSNNHMKMIIDIYCRYPRQTKPINLSSLQKLMLKSRCAPKQLKWIASVEEMKNVHNEYNNLYYWSNDFINGQSTIKVQVQSSRKEQDCEQWLEQNVWKYYD